MPFRVLLLVGLLVLGPFHVALSAEGSRVIGDESVTILGVRIGSSTFKDVIARLGEAKSWHTGDAALSESKICYRASSSIGETVIVFASNSEMAVPKFKVTAVRIYSPAVPFNDRRRCGVLNVAPSDLRTENGLALGVSPERVHEILWPKRSSKRDSLHYDSCRKRYMEKTDPYFSRWVGRAECFPDPARPHVDECSGVDLRFAKGAAIFLEIVRGDSVC